ncbi:hypothetical protein CspHIS471_0100620 [Cutaneotrichosporon sp. HIS471]|nr:hypothetical protein CspHIS471_0100620 [Cutaneotrichosporon sp. HIS471]
MSRTITNTHTTSTIQGVVISSLQERCIFHLDLKPENVVIVRPEHPNQETEPRIIDFGLSLSSLVPIPATWCGTLRYNAPEVAATGFVTPGADVWALGLMLWQIMVSPSHCLRELGYRARQPQDMEEWRLVNLCRGQEYHKKREYLISRILRRGPTEEWYTATVWATDLGRHMRVYIDACLIVHPAYRAPAGYVAHGLSNFWNHTGTGPGEAGMGSNRSSILDQPRSPAVHVFASTEQGRGDRTSNAISLDELYHDAANDGCIRVEPAPGLSELCHFASWTIRRQVDMPPLAWRIHKTATRVEDAPAATTVEDTSAAATRAVDEET